MYGPMQPQPQPHQPQGQALTPKQQQRLQAQQEAAQAPIYRVQNGNTRFQRNASTYAQEGPGKLYDNAAMYSTMAPIIPGVSGAVTKTLGRAGSNALLWSTTPMMHYNIPGAWRDRKNAKNYIQAGRAIDAEAGLPTGRKKGREDQYMRKQSSSVRLEDFLAAEFALGVIDTVVDPPRPKTVVKVSSPLRATVQTPTPLANTLYAEIVEKVAQAGMKEGVEKVSAPLSRLGGWGGSLVGGMIGLPLAVGALKTMDYVANKGVERRNEALAPERFERALQVALNDQDVRDQLIDPYTGETREDAKEALYHQYTMLNKYAPNVMKDPNLGAAYLESMAYRNAAGGSGREYMDTVRSFVDLNRSIEGTKFSIDHPSVGRIL